MTVIPHQALNTIRGVIPEKDLLHVSESDIVTAVKLVVMRHELREINNEPFIFTFYTCPSGNWQAGLPGLSCAAYNYQ